MSVETVTKMAQKNGRKRKNKTQIKKKNCSRKKKKCRKKVVKKIGSYEKTASGSRKYKLSHNEKHEVLYGSA